MTTATKMRAVFDDGKGLAVGEVLRESEQSLRLISGRKIPNNRVWLILADDEEVSLEAAREAGDKIDIAKLWHIAGGEVLDARDLCERFCDGARGDILTTAAVLHCALSHPIYFRRHGGKLNPARECDIASALESQKQRQAVTDKTNAMAAAMECGDTPPEIIQQQTALLTREDKTSPAYRALKKVTGGGDTAFARFFIERGLLTDARDYWKVLFHHAWPPRADNPVPPFAAHLPKAPAPAFSIDDGGTIEIDDAFSVTVDEQKMWRIGVHIAAPALAVAVDDDEDLAARKRMTSVYFPDEKHPMLSPAAVRHYSLAQDDYRPALSLYHLFNPYDGQILTADTVLEQVRLSAVLTPDEVEGGQMPSPVAQAYEKLKQFAGALPLSHTPFDKDDFMITAAPPTVRRIARRAVSLTVESLMRWTNTVWAEKIIARGGCYRSNGMVTARRETPPYAWFTSPLRRYIDLANQRLLLSVINNKKSPRQDWRQISQSFNRRYSVARDFQRTLNRHWTMRALQELAADDPLNGFWKSRGKVRLRDYPISGRIGGDGDGDLTVKIESLDFLRQVVHLRRP